MEKAGQPTFDDIMGTSSSKTEGMEQETRTDVVSTQTIRQTNGATPGQARASDALSMLAEHATKSSPSTCDSKEQPPRAASPTNSDDVVTTPTPKRIVAAKSVHPSKFVAISSATSPEETRELQRLYSRKAAPPPPPLHNTAITPDNATDWPEPLSSESRFSEPGRRRKLGTYGSFSFIICEYLFISTLSSHNALLSCRQDNHWRIGTS